MSQATAIAEAKRLQAIMQKHGVKCTVELKIGRENTWYTRKHVHMNHHTAGSSSGLTPSYALCRNGTSTLPGPLCNGYGGRDHVYRIVTMGMANHPGAGGPLTVDGFTIPYNSARPSCWGTEWEHNGTSPWPADMVDFMARSNAALTEFHGVSVRRQIEHSTWARPLGRKIDRNGYTADRGQQEIVNLSSVAFGAGDRVLRVTDPLMRGEDVKVAQRWAGLAGDDVDGVYGQQSAAAVGRAQAAAGLLADGVIGPMTWAAILQPAAPKPMLEGAILACYDSLPQWLRDQFGPPLIPETATPDGVGRYNHFQGDASIYWHPSTGAHPVWGKLRHIWSREGWETGVLGYPTSAEFPYEGTEYGPGQEQHFQGGILTWRRSDGHTWAHRFQG